MSVRVGDRGEQKLTVLTKAIQLAEHTLTVTRNENVFPKRSRWQLTNRIVTTALDVAECIRKANAIRVDKESDYIRRREYQQRARENAEWLVTLIDLAYRNLGTIGGDKADYWIGLVIEVEDLLSAWRKSDADTWRKKQKEIGITAGGR